jgi:hypothetical protein
MFFKKESKLWGFDIVKILDEISLNQQKTWIIEYIQGVFYNKRLGFYWQVVWNILINAWQIIKIRKHLLYVFFFAGH